MLHMEQKDYKLEIINELLKEENHLRGIAKKLGTNHMTISRRIRELEKENAVDSKIRGKNKVYFLKKTIEARSYVLTAEIYLLNQVIKKYPLLRGIIETIQKESKINLAVLFGSYAKGIAKPESDIDIYIDTKSSELKKSLSIINIRLSIKIGEYNKSSLLIKEIEKNHVILKGVEEFYEKNKFFD